MASLDGKARLEELEAVIHAADLSQAELASAIEEICLNELYREIGFERFEDYCEERLERTRQRAYQLMEFAAVVRRCQPVVDIPIPSERVAREIGRLPAAEQPAAWKAVVAKHGPRPTAREVAAEIAARLDDESPLPIIHSEPLDGVCGDLQELIELGNKYGVIYADPPWAYDNRATRANVESIYAGTMTVEEICDMPVPQLAADDAHLHLWTTNAFLHDAFHVMQAWGFDYRSVFVWCKPQMGIGNYWRVSHEFLLLGIRGNVKGFAERCHMSYRVIDRGEHSAKPDVVRDLVSQVSPEPRLELFGRKRVEGWTVFGNQVGPELQRRLA